MFYVKSKKDNNKYYYEQPELVDTQKVNDIIDMFNNDSNNSNLSNIQSLVDSLDSISTLTTNGYDLCGCLTLVNLLKIQMNKIIELEKLIPKKSFLLTPFNTNVETVINTAYIQYIQKYGIPSDGIFLPDLLAEFS
jgi:hypothetical protein